jgi:hypothetical protein
MTEFTKDDIEHYRKQYALWTSRGRITPEELHLIGRLRDALDHIERLQTRVQELEKQTSPFLFAGNAVLRDALRWHPVSEKPKNDERYCHCNISVDVLFRIHDKAKPIIAWLNKDSSNWVCDGQTIKTYNDSTWCHIPPDKDGD